MITLSIIIVSYNTKELLINCLHSIFRKSFNIDFEVIVVDNASFDDSAKEVKKNFPEIKLITNRRNVGFSKANNQAFKICKGEYILLLNPDTVVLSNVLKTMVNFMSKNPKCGVLGCKILNPDLTLQRSCFKFPTLLTRFLRMTYLEKLFPRNRFLAMRRLGDWNYNEVREVDFVSGACLMTRKEILENTGFLDENLFWTEDADLCYRIKKKGWNVCFTPNARVIHYGGQSSASNIYVKLLNQYWSQIKFYKKHYKNWNCTILKIMFLYELILKIIIRSIGVVFNRPRDAKIRLKAYFDVIKKIFPLIEKSN